MRKIETQEEKERKEKRKQTFLAVALTLILIGSTAGYAFFTREREGENLKVKIYGRDFFFQNNYWLTNYASRTLYFHNLPNETKNIESDELFNWNYQGQAIYFVNTQPAAQTILINLGEHFSRYQEACFEEDSEIPCNEEKNLPLKNCSDFLIIFKESEKTKVKKQENCIFLEGDFEKATDKFIYKLLKIEPTNEFNKL